MATVHSPFESFREFSTQQKTHIRKRFWKILVRARQAKHTVDDPPRCIAEERAEKRDISLLAEYLKFLQ